VLLVEQLYVWKNIKILDLSFNGSLLEGHMLLIACGIQQLHQLQKLCLSDNSVDSAAAIGLAEGVQNCPLLHTLDVSGNLIGSVGASVLVHSLKCRKLNM